MAAHRHFLKVLAALHGEVHRTFFVHDVHRAERPAVNFQRFAVLFRRVAIAVVKRIRFHNRAARNLLHQFGHHQARQNVGAVPFAGVQLHGDLAREVAADLFVELDEVLGVDHGRKIHVGRFFSSRSRRTQAARRHARSAGAGHFEEILSGKIRRHKSTFSVS